MRAVLLYQSIWLYQIRYCLLTTLMINRKNLSRAPSFSRSVLRHSELIPLARSRLIGVSGYEDRMFPRVTTLTASSARTARPEKKKCCYTTQHGLKTVNRVHLSQSHDSSVSEVTGWGFDDRIYNPGRGEEANWAPYTTSIKESLPGLKLSEREANNLPPSNVFLKTCDNGWFIITI